MLILIATDTRLWRCGFLTSSRSVPYFGDTAPAAPDAADAGTVCAAHAALDAAAASLSPSRKTPATSGTG